MCLQPELHPKPCWRSLQRSPRSPCWIQEVGNGGKSTPDLCFASLEEIPEWQCPRRTTWNRRNHHCRNDSILRATVTRDQGLPCLGAVKASVWGIWLAGCRFLCTGKYIALLIEWSGPQHPAHENVKSQGILFMTWRAQGTMNGWLLVFLSKVCCHKASWAVVLVAFQGVQKEALQVTENGW